MAKRPTLTDITAAFASASMTNANFDAIEQAFDNTLSRDGSTPNAMEADLDMNGFDILNVGNIESTADSISRGVVEEYLNTTRAEVASKSIDSTVDAIRTAGYTTKGDGGGALYVRVGAEPSHEFKVQSGDDAWWEGVAEGHRVYAEQFGAVGGGTSDDHTALTNALAYVKDTGDTLVAAGVYRIDSTLVFPAGRYGFEGPARRDLENDSSSRGFIWAGGNSDVMVEFETVRRSLIQNLVVNNRINQATDMTGVLIHNESAGGVSINHNYFTFMEIAGCNVGLQIGDFTNDGYDSNCDDLVIEDIIFYEVANPVIIDSDDSDNILFRRFVNGGPTTLGAYVGTRSHVIHAKRVGNGLRVDHGFARTDGITTDNAAILIDDGSFSTGYFSFEGGTTARVLDLVNAGTRDHSIINEITCTGIKDSSDLVMKLGAEAGVLLQGARVSGDIEIQDVGPVVATGTTFETGFSFVGGGLDKGLLHERQTSERSAPDAIASIVSDEKTLSSVGANQDDYDTGFATMLRQASSAAVNITGIDRSARRSGQTMFFLNTNASGGDTITLKHQDTNSTNLNRFLSVTGADIVLAGQEIAGLMYDTTIARWRIWKL